MVKIENINSKERLGQTAVITGGARGFGKSFGKALAALGSHVVLIDRDASAVELAAAEIRKDGGSAAGYAGDITDSEGIAKVMQEAAKLNSGIDILINNAGLHSDEYSKPILTMGFMKLQSLFEVNVMGTALCTIAAHPYMKNRKGANIVNISSMAAHMGGTAYGSSKLAVSSLTITFAREFGPDNIRVNAISPGMIMTDTISTELPEETKKRIKDMQFINTFGKEQDIVDAAVFLTSEKARFITGEVLRVTGGAGAGI